MYTILKTALRTWKQQRRQRLLEQQYHKRDAVLLGGIQLYAEITDARPACITNGAQQLLRIKLRIRLLNNAFYYAHSLTVTHIRYQQLIGKKMLIRFLPGDLSHIVLVF